MSAIGQSLRVHQAIARALVDNGVNTLFGLIGEANLYLTNSFIRDYGGKYVAAAHEAGAALMALGYSLQSDRLGVCTVTVGPAMVNTLTALVEGVKGSIPMLLLCGDTAVEDRDNIQSVSQREFITATGAGFEQLRSPASAVQDVATAMRRAVVERRPIALNMPADFQWCDVEYRPIHFRIPASYASVPEGAELDNAVGIIAAAKRPIILAGRGATSPEARGAVLRLADRIGAPVATTLKAKSLFQGEDYNLGFFGTLSTPATVECIIESDCVIAFGASLNPLTTSHGSFLDGKRLVQVNPESGEVGRNVRVDAGLVGDPAATADIILHWLDEAEIPSSGYRTDELRERIVGDLPAIDAFDEDGDGTVDYRRAMTCLDQSLPADRILVTDGGRFDRYVWRAFTVPGPRSFIPTGNFGSIGLGLSHAIGACVAQKDRPVVLITGDGGFMHGGLCEFNTAVRHGADLIVIVGNDGCYGAEHLHFQKRGLDPGLSFFDWPDLAPVAIALGGQGVTVRSTSDLAAAEEAIKGRSGPLLIDVKLDPERIPAF